MSSLLLQIRGEISDVTGVGQDRPVGHVFLHNTTPWSFIAGRTLLPRFTRHAHEMARAVKLQTLARKMSSGGDAGAGSKR